MSLARETRLCYASMASKSRSGGARWKARKTGLERPLFQEKREERRMPRLERWPMTFIESFPEMPWALGIGSRQILDSGPLTTHKHKGHELTFILDGEVSWETEKGERIDLRGGMMGLTQPGLLHRGQMDAIRPCRIVWFIVDLDAHESKRMRRLGELLRKAGNCGKRISPRLKALIAELKESLDEYSVDRNSKIKSLRLSCALDHALSLAAPAFASAEPEEEEAAGPMASIARKLVMQDLRSRVPVERMAKKAGFSVARFAELFKEECGMTPADFALRLRCAKAKELLKDGRTPVTRVAYMLGFSSGQHFSRAFKRYFGFTPSEASTGKK